MTDGSDSRKRDASRLAASCFIVILAVPLIRPPHTFFRNNLLESFFYFYEGVSLSAALGLLWLNFSIVEEWNESSWSVLVRCRHFLWRTFFCLNLAICWPSFAINVRVHPLLPNQYRIRSAQPSAEAQRHNERRFWLEPLNLFLLSCLLFVPTWNNPHYPPQFVTITAAFLVIAVMNSLVTASLGTRNAIAISRVSRWNPFIHYSVILCLNLTSLVLSMTLWVGHRGRALSSTLYRTAAHLLTPAIIAKGFIGPDLRSSLHLIHAAPWSDKLFLLIGGLLYVTLLKEVAGGLKSFERTDADYVQLAESLSFEGHFDEAEEVLAKVSNTTRFSEWARVPILLSRGELEAAEYCTKRALEFDPKNRHIPTSEDIFFNLHHLASSYPIPALCCLQLWQLSVERELREALLFQFSTYLLFAEDHQIDKNAVFERKAAQAPRLPTANTLLNRGIPMRLRCFSMASIGPMKRSGLRQGSSALSATLSTTVATRTALRTRPSELALTSHTSKAFSRLSQQDASGKPTWPSAFSTAFSGGSPTLRISRPSIFPQSSLDARRSSARRQAWKPLIYVVSGRNQPPASPSQDLAEGPTAAGWSFEA